jgi:hypothetical protein
MIVPGAGEPVAEPWTARPLEDVAAQLREATAAPDGVSVIAVDGRSAGGKTTFGARLAAHLPGAFVVHTDDVAWYESFFGWDQLMALGVLEPARRGRSVRFRPPAWDVQGREGAIEVPADTPFLIVEGVGASRRSLVPLIDAAVWVQSDFAEARRRGITRDLAERPDRFRGGPSPRNRS